MRNERIEIYTDGACSGNPGPGGWGAILFYPDGSVRELGGRTPKTTNNQMELQAAIQALTQIQAAPETLVTVFTDSKYVIQGITAWIFNWKKNGWRASTGKPVLNEELWKELDSLARTKKIQWSYVAGHSGHPLNDRADEIAVGYANQDLPDLFSGPVSNYPYSLGDSPKAR